MSRNSLPLNICCWGGTAGQNSCLHSSCFYGLLEALLFGHWVKQDVGTYGLVIGFSRL